jgi:hypothetical protein
MPLPAYRYLQEIVPTEYLIEPSDVLCICNLTMEVCLACSTQFEGRLNITGCTLVTAIAINKGGKKPYSYVL